MIEAGLIRESDKRPDPAMDDERRTYYAITGAGQKALETELDRYREVVAVATEKRLTPNAFADAERIARSYRGCRVVAEAMSRERRQSENSRVS